MSGAGAWLAQALAGSALLMAAVLLVRRPMRRLVGPQLAYALWTLPALRLLMPPLPPIWHASTPLARAGETVTVLIVDTVPAVSVPAALPFGTIAFGLWVAAAVLVLGWHVARHHCFCRHLLATATPLDMVEGVATIASPAAPGPLAFGIRRRYVAFPADLVRYDPGERALALAHELAHHRRHDLHANWAALVVLALHWPNPLAWLALRAFRADQELATDAHVLAGRSADDRHAYARAIVKAASPIGSPAPAACLHSVTDLKRRLHMLSTTRLSRRRLAAGGTAIILLTGTGLALTASSSGAAAAVTAVAAAATAPQDIPLAPPTVPTPPVAVPVPTTPAASTSMRKVKRVVVVRDGEAKTYEGADADAWLKDHPMPAPQTPPTPLAPDTASRLRLYSLWSDGRPDAPLFRPGGSPQRFMADEITTSDCGGADRPAVERRQQYGKRLIVICTDRMARLAADAERTVASAAVIERGGLASARVNLAMARVTIEHNRALSDAQRSQALAGIAQAEGELAMSTTKTE